MDIEHEKRLTNVEDRAKANTHRIEKLEARQDKLDELVGSVKVLATQYKTVESDVREIKKDVKELASKPGKRWDAVVDKILLTALGAIVLYILARLGF